MRLAHVRERHAPAGAAWRLAAAMDPAAEQWLDLELARRRLVAQRPELAHDDPVFRQSVTTLDAHLARGLRVETLGAIVEGFTPHADGVADRPEADPGADRPGTGRPDPDDPDPAILATTELRFGSPLLAPRSLRDGYGFEGHVRTMWERRGGAVPEAWYRLPVFYFSNVSETRGPDDPVWAPRGSEELDYELEIAALVDTPGRDLALDRAEDLIGGYMIFDDWSARDLQRDETTVRLGPAKGKDFASSFGPWLVTPDELADVRSGRGFDLAMTASVNGVETSRGRWSDAVHGFADLAARASDDVTLRPGDLLGSGTVGTGCLLEVRDATLGRYLRPGDEVVLEVERLGRLRTPIVARPS